MSIKVEIGQYREVNKGTLKATFSLIIYPEGQKILECRHFVSAESSWWQFPSKEVKREGAKSDFIPLVSYVNKEYSEKLKEAVSSELKKAKPQVKNEAKNQSNQGKEDLFQSESPPVWRN